MNKEWRNVMLFIGILIVVVFLVYVGFNSQEDDSIKANTREVVTSSNLEKKSVDFEGYRYCNFVFNYDMEEYVKKLEWAFKKFCNFSEGYPNIREFLYNEYFVEIEESDEVQFVAWYVGNGKIIINKRFKRGQNFDMYLAHEIAHSAAEALSLPSWLDEGIAQYAAYRFFNVQFKLKWYWFEGVEKWEPSTASISNNIKGYQHTGYIIRDFVESYGDDFIRDLLKELDGKINYGDDIDKKNQKVFDAIRKIVKNESLSVEEIIHKKKK